MKGLSLSTPMVIAWNEGRKDVTRRLMNPQPAEGAYFHHDEDGGFAFAGTACSFHKPRYLPGETVYIKETWAFGCYELSGKKPIRYKADGTRNDVLQWKSPRFMPEWASRSHTRIVSVRPERIQEITEEEAKREGFAVSYEEVVVEYDQIRQEPIFARENFQTLWETLHPGSWEKNEFVFRYALEKI